MKTAELTGSVSRLGGGLFDGVRRLAQSLAVRRVEVEVLGMEDGFTAEDLRSWGSVQVSIFPPRWPRRLGYSPGMVDRLTSCAPDIVHTHGIWLYPSRLAERYGRRSGCPHVISPHGMLDVWALSQSRRKKWIAYWLYEGAHLRQASCLRALCEAEARAMRRFGLTNPIAIIPNGIDLPGAGPQIEKGCMVRELKAKGRKVLLYLGRIHAKKGLANLLKAWAQVGRADRSVLSAWALVVAGCDQDGHENELKALATELGIDWQAGVESERLGWGAECHAHYAHADSTSVFFIGPRFGREKGSCYANCDAFVLPSVSEGLPLAVLEAWAYAKPVLITPACNLPEGLAAGAALRTEPEVRSIARGLAELVRLSDAERSRIGENGRALVSRRFAWGPIAEEIQRVYEWVLSGGSRPVCMTDF